jgi:hypothetical protein
MSVKRKFYFGEHGKALNEEKNEFSDFPQTLSILLPSPNFHWKLNVKMN